MCVNIHNADPRTRRIWSIGTLCVVAASLLTLFCPQLHQRHPEAFDALRGFLTGLALVFLLWSARRMRRQDCQD